MKEEDSLEDLGEGFNRKISQFSDLHLKYTYSNASSNSDYGLYEQTSGIELEEPKFIKDEELFEQLLTEIQKIKSLLYIDDHDICLYILSHYLWNTETMMVKYFTDDWSTFKQRMKKYSPQNLEKMTQQGICNICCSETILYSSGMCDHFYCRNCWASYIRNQLEKGKIFFGCMNQKQCFKAPVLKSFVRKIIPDLRPLYRRKICISYSIQSKDITYCPNDKCPLFCCKPQMMEVHLIKCPCGQLYCFKCRQQPHAPATCRQVQKWNQLLNSENINMTWIKNNTQECPNCKQPIEKKVGCSHMKCICQCEFCYECNQLWDEDHKMNSGVCPQRKKLQRKRKLSDRMLDLEGQLSKLMIEKEKHEKSLRICEELVKEEAVKSKVTDVKIEVICAWTSLKWTKIMLAFEKGEQIDQEVERDFMESIRGTIQPIEEIIHHINTISVRQLYHMWQLVLQRLALLKKNKNVWIQAYEVRTPTNKYLSFST